VPLVKATLGTSQAGERLLVVSTDVDGGDGVIEFPLDHVALTARRVGSHSAAQLWAEAVRAAGRLAGGAALPEHACDHVSEVAEHALGRLPSTSLTDVSVDVVSSNWKGECVLEAITDLGIPAFVADRYLPPPTVPGHSWRMRHHPQMAVGDRVHVHGELDGVLIDRSSFRLGGGMHTRVRTVDGRVLRRRPSELRRAPERDVIVANDQEVHTFTAETEALDSSGPYRYGVALLALVHSGCPCEYERSSQRSPNDGGQ